MKSRPEKGGSDLPAGEEPRTLLSERHQSQLWKVRPGVDFSPNQALLEREFLAPEALSADHDKRLHDMLCFAARYSPFYGALFHEEQIDPAHHNSQAILRQIPPLSKETLQREADALTALTLPTQSRIAGKTTTSGTTGQPTTVFHSWRSLSMFKWLKLRELRWFRVNVRQTMMAIRPAVEIKGMVAVAAPTATLRGDAWPLIGRVIHTGSFVALSNTSRIDVQRAALLRERPEFLLMQAAGLEHLALACAKIKPEELSLEACQSISQTLTPPMRETAERRFGAVVHENYGLNEVGLVASRCPEGGRFHVHTEQALVEIVDSQGHPCKAGESGRLLVTSLVNDAMPLFRYDSGDRAVALDGPCPCGRTLPSFGAISGRYRRISALPEGTWQCWASIQYALRDLPAELAAGIRRYQVRQRRDSRWKMRIQFEGDGFERVVTHLKQRFSAASGATQIDFEVVLSGEFDVESSGKFQNFLSDHMPGAQDAAPPVVMRPDGG